jgi:hypothetical protein
VLRAGAYEEGFRLFDEQVARAPDDHSCDSCAPSPDSRGDFAASWDEYEALREPLATPPYAFPWDGRLRQGALLVYGEQGLGDQIMFASCLPELQALVPDCIVECNPRLGRLFERSFLGAWPGRRRRTIPRCVARRARIRARGTARRFRSAACRAGSAPPIFRGIRGFLRVDPARAGMAYWLAACGAGPRIGVSGGRDRDSRRFWSPELAQLAPVLAGVLATWVSLQYTDCRAEIAAVGQRHGVTLHHWQEAIDDYDETAALVAALDVVVTVCTALVHLSGALGQRTIVMVPYAAEWRYGAAGEAMPWYPAVRLLRQRAPGGWADLLERVKDELLAQPRAV